MFSCCSFESDSLDECIKVIDDPVVEAVELRSPLVSDSGISADGTKKSRGQRGVDALEELQEDEADRVSLRQELIAVGTWKLGDEPLGSQLGEIVAERGKRIAVGGASERLDDVRVDIRSGEAIAGSDVREAHEGMHQGELAGVIKPQSWNAFPCRTNGRFGEPSEFAAIDEGLEDILLHVEIIIVDG